MFKMFFSSCEIVLSRNSRKGRREEEVEAAPPAATAPAAAAGVSISPSRPR